MSTGNSPVAAVVPDFVLVGSAKCGTTALCGLLAQHPDVFLHPRKELNFFSFDAVYARGFEWYVRQFDAGGGCTAVGEGSPTYAKRGKHPHAAERLARHLPHARLLFIARHPLRRMESAWLHARRAGHRSFASFARTVERFPEYVDTSDFRWQLEPYAERFPGERIFVLFFEDLIADPAAVAARAFRFLGVDDAVAVDPGGTDTNPSLGRRSDTALLRALRRVPGVRALERNVPAIGRFTERHLRHVLTERPPWPDTLRAQVVERLGGSTRHFLEAHGKPPDFWDLAD